MDWYLGVLRKYAVFEGRARRKEYWVFALINIIITLVLGFIDQALGWFYLLQSIYSLAVLLPSLAVTVRRLHDTGRSAWWLLLFVVPVLGWLVLFVFMVLDSDDYNNAYGPNPKN